MTRLPALLIALYATAGSFRAAYLEKPDVCLLLAAFALFAMAAAVSPRRA